MKTIRTLLLCVCALSLSGCMTTAYVVGKAEQQPAYCLAVPVTVPVDIATFPIQITMFWAALAHMH